MGRPPKIKTEPVDTKKKAKKPPATSSAATGKKKPVAKKTTTNKPTAANASKKTTAVKKEPTSKKVAGKKVTASSKKKPTKATTTTKKAAASSGKTAGKKKPTAKKGVTAKKNNSKKVKQEEQDTSSSSDDDDYNNLSASEQKRRGRKKKFSRLANLSRSSTTKNATAAGTRRTRSEADRGGGSGSSITNNAAGLNRLIELESRATGGRNTHQSASMLLRNNNTTISGNQNNNNNNIRNNNNNQIRQQQKPGVFDKYLTPHAVRLALQTAVANLRVGTTTPVGRREQLAQVLNFITAGHSFSTNNNNNSDSSSSNQNNNNGGGFIISNVLQLFGMPGTGKTAIVKHALTMAQQRQWNEGHGHGIGLSYVFLNGFLLEKPGELYCRLWQHLSKVRLGDEQLLVPEAAAVALEKRFRDQGWPSPAVLMNSRTTQNGHEKNAATTKGSSKNNNNNNSNNQSSNNNNNSSSSVSPWRCIIVIDEVDKLNENSTGWRAFFRLLEWLELTHCHCRLITMSNSMQLPDAAKTRSRVSTSSHQRVVFTPYQAAELQAILLDRVKDIVPKVFNDSAIDYICKQIASQNGDVRRLLQTTSVAIHEVLSLNTVTNNNSNNKNQLVPGLQQNNNNSSENMTMTSHNNNQLGLPIPETRDSGIITLRQLHSTVRRVLHDRLPELFHEELPELTRLAICTLCIEASKSSKDNIPMNLASWRQTTVTALRRHGLKIRMHRIVNMLSNVMSVNTNLSSVATHVGAPALTSLHHQNHLLQQQQQAQSGSNNNNNSDQGSSSGANNNGDQNNSSSMMMPMMSQTQQNTSASSSHHHKPSSLMVVAAAGAIRPIKKINGKPIVELPTKSQQQKATTAFIQNRQASTMSFQNLQYQQQKNENNNNNSSSAAALNAIPPFPYSLQHQQQLQNFINNTCSDEYLLPDHDWYNVVATLREVALVEVHVVAVNQMTQNMSLYQLQQQGMLQQALVPAGRTQWSMSFYSQPKKCTVTLLQNYETVRTLCELKFEAMKCVFE